LPELTRTSFVFFRTISFTVTLLETQLDKTSYPFPLKISKIIGLVTTSLPLQALNPNNLQLLLRELPESSSSSPQNYSIEDQVLAQDVVEHLHPGYLASTQDERPLQKEKDFPLLVLLNILVELYLVPMKMFPVPL